ncbi:hypothetical protein CF15_00225 [Pyrodictium occultum]|uniref:DHHA1 domain-containing protein n=1 Tax=Pyrodictium occultum TaxID=2309 RepID=A0A0V8RTF2_PYROC|nr:DHH family phosphoesterase [Pyrodictium occultum]KSW11335.1 hypothetical protein CF15_00225 [Pyrodictium occultum]
MKQRYAVVTHTDLDGVASAAIYLRLAGAEPDIDASITFTEPYKLHRVLQNIDGVDRLAIMDLGPNADTFNDLVEAVARLVESGVRVEWYDHHRWAPEWVEKLSSLGARMHVDTSTCGAGVVAKYAPAELEAEPDGVIERLARATCAADLWRWDDPLAPRLYRVVDRYHGARGDRWKREILRGFWEGSLWWPELDEALNEYLKREFSGFNDALRNVVVADMHGCRAVLVLKRPGPPNASILGNSLIDRLSADVVAIVRRRGRGISLRSRRVNVREIAFRLGGGGHPRAAGAPLKMPLRYRLLAFFWPKARLYYAKHLIEQVLEDIGGCPVTQE